MNQPRRDPTTPLVGGLRDPTAGTECVTSLEPPPDKMRAALRRLRAVAQRELDTGPVLVDCAEPEIRRDGDPSAAAPCRTIACHGGWLRLAPAETVWVDGYVVNTDGARASFTEGADLFAAFIFGAGADRRTIEAWAEYRKDLWGFRHGDAMFTARGGLAFGYAPGAGWVSTAPDAVPLRAVIEHWDAVARRIDADNERG